MNFADEAVRIPMFGFTRSFNISVSAAIILHHLSQQLHHSGLDWKLEPGERDEIMLHWLYKTIKHLRGKDPRSQVLS
jgi:tRNA (guanosine-2'-O-)-methyltransferase